MLGRSGNPDLEVHVDTALGDNVPILRRHGGGCAVVLDSGNVIVSLALPIPGLASITETFVLLSTWLIEALDLVGVHGVAQQGTSDLTLADRKISGSCIYRSKGLLYYSATLLVHPDLGLVERYLKHPPREPAYRRNRPHRDFLGTLASHVSRERLPHFVTQLSEILTRRSGARRPFRTAATCQTL